MLELTDVQPLLRMDNGGLADYTVSMVHPGTGNAGSSD